MLRRSWLMLLSLTVLLAVIFDNNVTAAFNGDCVSFLASEPQAVDADFKDGGFVWLDTLDVDYHLKHRIALTMLGTVAEDNETSSLCVGFYETKSRTLDTSDTGDDSLATMTAVTNTLVATGIVNVSAKCWDNIRQIHSCDPVFIPMPEVMSTSLYAHSPLNERFWTLLATNNFKNSWVKELSINSIKKKIPSSWIPNLRLTNLKLLKIKGNDWGRPQALLSPLPALERLDLTFNNIQELPADTFKNTPALRDILLARNNLSVFPSGLENLARLSLLDITNPEGRAKLVISDTDISSLHRVNVFGLENINLSANVTALLDLPKLTFLNLSGCGIDNIDDIAFEAKRKPLVLLDLSKNDLVKLPPKLFSSLNNIRTLLLQENSFVSCPAFIDNLPLLTDLVLSHNKISRLSTLCFEKPHNNLERLDLSNNQISYITDGVFQNLNSLTELRLSNNKLATLKSTVFRGVTHLQILDLSHNQLTSEIYFKNIEIEHLDLSNNRLKSLANISDSDSKLISIDVSKNNITQWELPSHTKWLNLSYNGITKIPKEMRDSFDSRLTAVDLGGNFFNCCQDDLNELQKWLQNTHVDIVILKTKYVLKCRIPGENQQYPIRTFLDEEGLCHGQSTSGRSYGRNNTSVLYGVTGFLTVLVLVLSSALAYIVYKQRHNVLTWFRFTDS